MPYMLKRARILSGRVRYGRGGLFSGIAKIGKALLSPVAKVALPIAKSLPGVGTAITIGGAVLGGAKALKAAKAATAVAKFDPAFAARQAAAAGGRINPFAIGAGAAAAGAAGGYMAGQGASGFGGRRSRRMNPMNGKAATRAIRRVKAARDMLRKIEAQMPKQRCGCGSSRRKK